MGIIVAINYYKKDGSWSDSEERAIDSNLTEREVRDYLREVNKHPNQYATYKFSSGSRLKSYLVTPQED